MARIRSIKPSIWSDNRFVQLSNDARLLCLGMISNADDDGRIIASGAALVGAVFPHDTVSVRKIERWRDEIETVGLIVVYRQGRGVYAHFPRWRRHQRIQKSQPSTLPRPPASNGAGTGQIPLPEPPDDENEYGNGSATDSDTEGERDKEGETEEERETETEAAAVAAAHDGDDPVIDQLLDQTGSWMPPIAGALRPHIATALDAGIDQDRITEGLREWRSRPRAQPGLLPHLIQDAIDAPRAITDTERAAWT